MEILSHLPAMPPSILGALPFPGPFARMYTIDDQKTSLSADATSAIADRTWKTLLVVNHVNIVNLRLAIAIACEELKAHVRENTDSLLNATMYFLKVSLDLGKSSGDPQIWAVVSAFLWTSWQRGLMLHIRPFLASQLNSFDYGSHFLSFIRF
jgi:hypothetical protein